MTAVQACLQMKSAIGSVLRSHRGRLLTLAVAVGVIAAACGGGSTPTSTAPDQSSDTGGQGGARGDAEFGLTEEEVAHRVDAIESLIATCMTDAGFEYVPVDYATARAAMDSNSNRKSSGLTADEFRAEFGYGITTLFAGAADQATLGAGEQNIRIRDGLATADRVAYNRALYGENPDATFVVALDEEDFSQTGGCTSAAVAQVFSADELGPTFVNYQNARDVRVDEDPRVIAAYKDWAGCMRQAGYSYSDSAEIDADLASRLDVITGGADPGTLSADAQAALVELQGEERAIAAADHDCDLKFVDAIKTQVETELLGPSANQN